MKNFVLTAMMLIIFIAQISAQKYFTKTGNISFYSNTPMEKIEGHSKSASCVLDMSTGKMEFAVLVKGFQFEKALMQEHFNENYMESTKFPKAVFKGQIADHSSIDIAKNGKYNVKVAGQLTIHGVMKDITTDAVINVNNGKLESSATFNVDVADFGISIPSLVKDNIAKSIKIAVNSNLEPLKM
ncbi:MAG: YceI family protein [Saprospiraceae bacterium]|nr:YceI family protein [Saprospiraceae bacterium]